MKATYFGLILLAWLPAWTARSEEHGCCAGCGQHGCLKPVCRLVCEPKTVAETVYDCHCEDFCTLGPSRKCGESCGPDCRGHMTTRTLWQPSCGHVRQRHVLVKHEVAKETPHYKCVVEYVCDGCCGQCGRVPCEEGGRLDASPQPINAAAGRAAPYGTVSVPVSEETKWSLSWRVLFGKRRDQAIR